MENSKKYNVVSTVGAWEGMTLGVVYWKVNTAKGDGWVYVPFNQMTRSRRGWDTPDAALKGRVKNYRLEEKS